MTFRSSPVIGLADRSAGATYTCRTPLPASLPVLRSAAPTVSAPLATFAFGSATAKDKTKSASTTMTFKCTPLTAYTVTIDNGKYFDGTTRRMFGGQAQGQVWYVDYQLYRDATHLLPWNSTLAGTAVGVVPLSGQQTLTLYGEAQLKNVRAAPYLDTVTVTLDF